MAVPKRASRVIPLRAPPSTPRGVVIGRLTGLSERGPLVDFAGNTHGALEARLTVRLSRAELESAVAEQREVVLQFEEGRSDKPLIGGVIEPMPSVEREVPESKLEALVDGKRVVLEAEDEIVLRCGKASITMRRNGRIVVRGTYVETASEGVHRIKGGAVLIN